MSADSPAAPPGLAVSTDILPEPPAQSHESASPALEPSKPLPAEHPSAPLTPRSRPTSIQHSSPAAAAKTSDPSPQPQSNDTRPPDPLEAKTRRVKSVSLSIPVLANQGYEHKRAASQSQPPTEPAAIPRHRATNSLRINIPSASDVNFLTALASQERHVLELKEQLSKAEDELIQLKSIWVTSESKKRQSEARGVHRMTSTSSTTSAPSKPLGITGPPTVESLYEEMARRKATMGEALSTPVSAGGERTPRRRFFNGSRQLRALSLATPPIFETAEHAEPEHRSRAISTPHQLDGLANGSPDIPPTPDLIEEEEDTDPSSSSAYSSSSPQRKRTLRSSMRNSIQMAAEFREGLWTFFEDLKQATYGEEARMQDIRAQEVRTSRSSDKDEDIALPLDQPKSQPPTPGIQTPAQNPAQNAALKKQTIRRQTWQFRPADTPSDAPLIDNTSFWEEQGVPESVEVEVPRKQSLKKEKSSNSLKVGSRFEQDGETWDSWDSPKRGRSPTSHKTGSALPSPAPSLAEGGSRKSSQSTRTARESSSNETLKSKHRSTRISEAFPLPRSMTEAKEEFRRDSMAWPMLEKIKSGHISRGVNSLLDDWERSLMPPEQQQQRTSSSTARSASQLGGVSPARPHFQRSNSRLDNVYQ